MPYVYLDVGGTLYSTSIMTLEKIGDSMLAKLCQPCWEDGGKIGTSRDNPIVIDRDGEMFKYILNYLRREKQFTFPDADICFFKDLFVEAQYFGISTLCGEIYDNYLLPNKIWASESEFNPVEGQTATCTTTDELLLDQLAVLFALQNPRAIEPANQCNAPVGVLCLGHDGDRYSYNKFRCRQCGEEFCTDYLDYHLEKIRYEEENPQPPRFYDDDPERDRNHWKNQCFNKPDCCKQLIRLICEKRDILKLHLSSSSCTVSFVRIPTEQDMVDVKFLKMVIDKEEYPKNDCVVRMKLGNFRPDFF